MSTGTRRPIALASAAAAIVFAAGCELSDTVAPDLQPRAVVHAVLNPNATVQTVIVERTLTSYAVGPQGPAREAIRDARVIVYGPRNDSAVAVHDAGNPGMYRLASVTIRDGTPGIAAPEVLRVRPGERFRLRVETSLGVVTGETTVPVAGAIDAARRTFNVDQDTLWLQTEALETAGYMLRHETSTGGSERFITDVDAPLVFPLAQSNGDVDDEAWEFEFARESMRPGHAQNFVVVAVDSNYFRYYVAGFDPFGDDTRGNTLTGGVGLFGSVATVMTKTLDLVADMDTPIEATWTAERPSVTLPATLTLYTSPYFPGQLFGGMSVMISGRGRNGGNRVVEASGSMNGNAFGLEIIDLTGIAGPVGATGLLTTDSLVLTDTRTGERLTYRKR